MSAFIESTGEHKWFYEESDSLEPLDTPRARRCCSCRNIIKPGAIVLKFFRFRHPKNDIELRIYHFDQTAQVHMAPWYMCEICAFFYKSITKQLPLDFSIDISLPMIKTLKEYEKKFGALKL